MKCLTCRDEFTWHGRFVQLSQAAGQPLAELHSNKEPDVQPSKKRKLTSSVPGLAWLARSLSKS